MVAAARSVRGEPAGPRSALWAGCTGGAELEVAAELAALGWRPTAVPRRDDVPGGRSAGLTWERGSVYGEADAGALYRTLWAARTPSRVALLLLTTTAETLDDVRRGVGGLDLGRLPDAPFAVRARRVGEHDFRSPDLAGTAGAAVIAAYRRATGRRLPVDLDDPVTEILVELVGARLRVGIALTAASLHRRHYYRFRHHAALKSTLAAVLLVLAGWRADETLLDPMCGGGTVPIEAALAAMRRPPRTGSLPRLEALGLHHPATASSVGAALRAAARGPEGLAPIIGRDRAGRCVRGARDNAAAAGVAAALDLARGDATRLEDVSEVDCVVTNPPYGVRLGRPRDLADLYRRTLAAVADRLRPDGRAVLLTAAKRAAERAAADVGLAVTARRRLSLGSLDAVAYRLERDPSPGGR